MRDKALNEIGLKIIRFRSEEVAENLSHVVEKIQELISK